MNYEEAVELLPALVAQGKALEAVNDIHVLIKDAEPIIADQTWTDKAKLLATLVAAAKSGELGEVEAATYSLAKIICVLLADPAHSAETLDLIKSLVSAPDDTEPNASGEK